MQELKNTCKEKIDVFIPYLTALSYAIPKRKWYSLFPTYQEELHHQSRTVFSTNHATDRKRQ
jgi:hypothetical protein